MNSGLKTVGDRAHASYKVQQIEARIQHMIEHRRRLVINIGGKNLGHKYWGAKNLRKIYFQTTLSNKL